MLLAVQVNLVEVELPEQNLFVILYQQGFRILQEVTENLDDLKMVTVRGYHGCTQQSAVQGTEEKEQRTITILPSLHDLINMMDMQNMNNTRSVCQSEISG